MSVFSGELLVYITTGGTKLPIGYCTKASLSVNQNTKDISHKESGSWIEKINGKLGWSISGEGFYALATETTGKGADALYDAMITRNALPVVFGLEGQSSTYSGSAFINSFEISSQVDDTITYSISLEGTGVLTRAESTSATYSVFGLGYMNLTATTTSFSWSVAGVGATSVQLESSNDGLTGWTLVSGSADSTAPLQTSFIATTAAGVKYYRVRLTNGTTPVYSNVVMLSY